MTFHFCWLEIITFARWKRWQTQWLSTLAGARVWREVELWELKDLPGAGGLQTFLSCPVTWEIQRNLCPNHWCQMTFNIWNSKRNPCWKLQLLTMEKDESAPCRRVTTHGGNFFLTSDAFSFSRSQDVRSFTFVFTLVLSLFYLCLRMSEEFYRLRSFSINKGRLIKLGDSIASRLVLQHIITTYCIVTYFRDQLQSSNIDAKANIPAINFPTACSNTAFNVYIPSAETKRPWFDQSSENFKSRRSRSPCSTTATNTSRFSPWTQKISNQHASLLCVKVYKSVTFFPLF